jgi:hypothetical protein
MILTLWSHFGPGPVHGLREMNRQTDSSRYLCNSVICTISSTWMLWIWHFSAALSYMLLENLICFSLIILYRNVLFASHHLYHVFASLHFIFFTNRNMTIEVEKTRAAVGFLDPECLCSTMLNNTKNTLAFSVSYMWNAFELYAKKNFMLTAYLSTNRWIVVVIIPKQRKVYYLDSLKTIKTNTNPFEQIINE